MLCRYGALQCTVLLFWGHKADKNWTVWIWDGAEAKKLALYLNSNFTLVKSSTTMFVLQDSGGDLPTSVPSVNLIFSQNVTFIVRYLSWWCQFQEIPRPSTTRYMERSCLCPRTSCCIPPMTILVGKKPGCISSSNLLPMLLYMRVEHGPCVNWSVMSVKNIPYSNRRFFS